jgi:hypothetical protein
LKSPDEGVPLTFYCHGQHIEVVIFFPLFLQLTAMRCDGSLFHFRVSLNATAFFRQGASFGTWISKLHSDCMFTVHAIPEFIGVVHLQVHRFKDCYDAQASRLF